MTEEVADYPTQNKRIIPLTHKMFDDDAVFLENVPDSVVLKSKKSDKWVSFDYKGMQYLGIWHTPKTEAPFVCIEPWYGRCDKVGYEGEFAQRDWVIHLSANGSFRTYYTIELL
jgi:galactose mutarotase-like enzyme